MPIRAPRSTREPTARPEATLLRWRHSSDELDAVTEIHVRSYPDLAEKWRVSTGGERFVLLEPETVAEVPASDRFEVVLDWFAELPR